MKKKRIIFSIVITGILLILLMFSMVAKYNNRILEVEYARCQERYLKQDQEFYESAFVKELIETGGSTEPPSFYSSCKKTIYDNSWIYQTWSNITYYLSLLNIYL